MDRTLFLLLNQYAGHGRPTDTLACAFAVYGLLLLALALMTRWLWPGKYARHERHTVLLAVIATIFAVGLAQLPALFFYRARPYVTMPSAINLIGVDPSNSFPGVHATAGYTIAWIMGWGSPRWAIATWPIAVLMAWARVYGGVHYPSDQLAGFLLAWLVAWVAQKLRPDLAPALDRITQVLSKAPSKSPER